jgi:hypothetical protein
MMPTVAIAGGSDRTVHVQNWYRTVCDDLYRRNRREDLPARAAAPGDARLPAPRLRGPQVSHPAQRDLPYPSVRQLL